MSEQEKKETVQEAKILEALSHPNIVKFIEVFKTKKGKLCIVMDFADGGDLQNRMKEQRGRNFSESQVLEWFTQICLGLKHIHDRKILHRDLKGQNIFLTKQGIVKIGDFGIAKVLATTMQNARTVVGTPYYLSPEIVQSKPYNFKSDIWSLGVVLYELCALKPPFDAPSLHFLAMKIVRGAYNPLPSTYTSELRQLIGQLLNTNEKIRPDVNKILSMPIMQNKIKAFLTETIYQNEFSHTILHKQNVFDPKQMQQKQIQNLQQQIQQNKAVPVQQQQARPLVNQGVNNQVVPRYNPTGQNRPQVNQVQQQQQQPLNRQQQNRNGISPGMQAVFGGGVVNNPPTRAQVPQYGAANYQPSNAKPNYHYQQQKPQQTPAQQQVKHALPIQVELVKPQQLLQQNNREKEQKEYQDRMKMIDQKLKEKEAELRKIEEDKKERDKKRQQYEKELLEKVQKQREQEKKQKEQEQQMQKRKMQEEQARKIQETQIKRKEELEKQRREEIKRRQAEEEKKKDEQRKNEEKAIQDRIQRQIEKQKEQQEQDFNWIKKMTEDAQNKILDIEKKIIAKEQQQPIPINFDPPKVKQNPPKTVYRVGSAREIQPKSIQQQEVKKAIPSARQESEVVVDRKLKEAERKKALEDAKKNWKKQNNSKQQQFVQMVGVPENLFQQDSDFDKQKIEVKQTKELAQSNQNWHKPSALAHQNHQNRVYSEKSPQPQQQSHFIEDKPKKLSPPRENKPKTAKTRQYNEANAFENKPSDPIKQDDYVESAINQPEEDYTEIYQMYEEMLQLVKNDFNADNQEESKQSDDSDSSDEGFNDERDSDWDKDPLNKNNLKIQAKSENKSPVNQKKRFDQTLQTIQEESEPENTFANTRQQKPANCGNSNIQDIQVDQEDRDDIDLDDDSTDISSSKQEENKFQDFTFVHKSEENQMFDQISKFTSVEHMREFLEKEIGEEKIMKAYPILKEFGDNIFFQEKTEELIILLKEVMSIEEIGKYQAFFASLIFMELQAEREGGGEIGIVNAMKTLKNINTTACFGKII